MFEKNLAISDLLDTYSAVLSDRHRELLDYYYNQDLSLSEIAELVGISRQGVRDGIKKAEEELFFLEERLHLLQKTNSLRKVAARLLENADESTERAVGETVMESLLPAQQIVKIVHEELITLMGSDSPKLEISSRPPTVVMMVGLQGTGKTTHAAKIAGMYKKKGKKVKTSNT